MLYPWRMSPLNLIYLIVNANQVSNKALLVQMCILSLLVFGLSIAIGVVDISIEREGGYERGGGRGYLGLVLRAVEGVLLGPWMQLD